MLNYRKLRLQMEKLIKSLQNRNGILYILKQQFGVLLPKLLFQFVKLKPFSKRVHVYIYIYKKAKANPIKCLKEILYYIS